MDKSGVDSRRQSPTSFALAAALTVWWLVSAVTYARLPALMPMHFALSGVADGPLKAPNVAWFLFPAIASIAFIALELVVRTAATNPSVLNIPHKDEHLRLGAAERVQVLREVRCMTNLIMLCVGTALAAIQFGAFRAGQHGEMRMGHGPLLITALAVASMMLAVLRGYLRVNKRLSELA